MNLCKHGPVLTLPLNVPFILDVCMVTANSFQVFSFSDSKRLKFSFGFEKKVILPN